MDERAAIERLKAGDIGGLDELVVRYQVRAARAASSNDTARTTTYRSIHGKFVQQYNYA